MSILIIIVILSRLFLKWQPKKNMHYEQMNYKCPYFTYPLRKAVNTGIGKRTIFDLLKVYLMLQIPIPSNMKQYKSIIDDNLPMAQTIKQQKEYIVNLTNEEKEILESYTGSFYTVINDFLRGKKIPSNNLARMILSPNYLTLFKQGLKIPKFVRDDMDHIATINMFSGTYANDIADVTRRLRTSKKGKQYMKKFAGKYIEKLNKIVLNAPRSQKEFLLYRGMNNAPNNYKKDKIVTRKPIQSWTLDPQVALQFGDYIQVLRVGKNTPFLHLETVSVYPEEEEVLLCTCAKYQHKEKSAHTVKKAILTRNLSTFCKSKFKMNIERYNLNLLKANQI